MIANWRRCAWIVSVLVGAYHLLRWAFAEQSEGLFTPDASFPFLPLLLGFCALGLRLVGLFVVLPIGTYWLVCGVVRRLTGAR